VVRLQRWDRAKKLSGRPASIIEEHPMCDGKAHLLPSKFADVTLLWHASFNVMMLYNIVMSHLDPTKSARKAFGLHRINESSALYRHGANLDD